MEEMQINNEKSWSHHWLAETTSVNYPAEGLIRLVKGNYPRHAPITLENLTVLDIGSGDGRNSEFLRLQGAVVSGVEISHDICSSAKKRYPHIDFRIGTSKELPFADRSFEVVVAWNSIYYMNDAADSIKQHFIEAKRVLSGKGRILLSIPMASSFVYKNAPTVKSEGQIDYVEITEDPFQTRNGAIFAKFGRLETLVETLNESGFQVDSSGEQTGDWFGLRYDWRILDCSIK